MFTRVCVFVTLCIGIGGQDNGWSTSTPASPTPRGMTERAVLLDDESVSYKGLLTTNCVNHYHRMYVTRTVPPRTYRYYHEMLMPAMLDYDDEEGVEFGWRIVGGRVVSIEQVPFQVLYGKYCGGALLAPEWVITAAHCKEREKYVYVGSTQRSLARAHLICAHFTHPLWNMSRHHTHDYDYQLVLLEKPVPVTAATRPIAIGNFEDLQPGTMVGVSGWGHLEFRNSRMQDLLRRTFVPIMSDSLCREMPDGNYNRITPRMFCAGYINGTKDSCQGDSGGPAVVGGRLVGLVSYGVGCAGARHPGVYSLLPAARHWIRSVTCLPL